jgi:hypothetical protein
LKVSRDANAASQHAYGKNDGEAMVDPNTHSSTSSLFAPAVYTLRLQPKRLEKVRNPFASRGGPARSRLLAPLRSSHLKRPAHHSQACFERGVS